MSSSSSASATTTSPTEIATISKMSSQKKEDPLIQQQQQMRAKSIEKELERNQYEKDRKSTGSKASRKQPPPPPPPPKMSLHEHLYKDPIDYTGEHLIDAFSFEPLLKSNEEYSQLYGIHETDKNLEEIRKQRKQARIDLENNSNDEAARAVIENTKACIAALYGIDIEEMAEEIRKQRTPAFLDFCSGNNHDDDAYDAVIESINEVMIKGNDESWTMFKDKKKCSMTTITQQAQIEQEQELQEDYNNIKKINIKNNNSNVFNELITYYNNGGSGGYLKSNDDGNEGSRNGGEITFVDFRNHLLDSGQVDKIVVVNNNLARVILYPGSKGIPHNNHDTLSSSSSSSAGDSRSNRSRRDGGHAADNTILEFNKSSSTNNTIESSSSASESLGSSSSTGNNTPVYHFYIGSVESFEEKLSKAQYGGSGG